MKWHQVKALKLLKIVIKLGIKHAADLGLEKLPSTDPFEELDPMITDSEEVFNSNTLHLAAIACLTEDRDLQWRDGTDSDLNEDDKCEWATQENRGAFDLFEDEFVQIL